MTNEKMEYPESIYEFLLDYSFKDEDEIYTNGIMLIPTFRVKQAIEHYYESQPCEDCISRKGVLDKKELVELEDGQSFYCINPKDVETLPSVTPQPKMGEWISNPLADYAGEGYFICSKCKNDVYDVSDYCPNCGADMRGDANEKNENNM